MCLIYLFLLGDGDFFERFKLFVSKIFQAFFLYCCFQTICIFAKINTSAKLLIIRIYQIFARIMFSQNANKIISVGNFAASAAFAHNTRRCICCIFLLFINNDFGIILAHFVLPIRLVREHQTELPDFHNNRFLQPD